MGSSHSDIWDPLFLGAGPLMPGASAPSKGSGWLLSLRVQSVDSFVSGEGQGWLSSLSGHLYVPEGCPGDFCLFPWPSGISLPFLASFPLFVLSVIFLKFQTQFLFNEIEKAKPSCVKDLLACH